MIRFTSVVGAVALACLLLATGPALAAAGGNGNGQGQGGQGGGGGGSNQGGGGGGGSNQGGNGGSNQGGGGGGSNQSSNGGQGDNGNHGDGNNGHSNTPGGPAAKDHEVAKRAVDASEAMPLDKVLDKFKDFGSFTVIDVKLARRDDDLIYVFKYIDSSGMVRIALLDARTGDLIR